MRDLRPLPNLTIPVPILLRLSDQQPNLGHAAERDVYLFGIYGSACDSMPLEGISYIFAQVCPNIRSQL